MPIGIFTKNSQCQLAMERMEPAIEGPAAADTAITMALIPIPLPRNSGGYMSLINAGFTLMMHAAPIPCMIRAMVRVTKSLQSAQENEATVNRETPMRNILLYP